jgi:hypothetical protein
MFGTRSPPKAAESRSTYMGTVESERLQIEAAKEDPGEGYIQPGAVEGYLRLRAIAR